MADVFDGLGGRLVAHIMARMNADAENEAVELLAPSRDARTLVIGFGPGVGIEALVRRTPAGYVLGIDPSSAMMSASQKRLRSAASQGLVELQQTTADRIAAANESFDGAIAVNTLQLCEPIDSTARELSRVLRPGATLVTLTHDWAAARHAGTAERWLVETTQALEANGFVSLNIGRAKSEKGRALRVCALRASG